jgi:hypothetical protein
MNDTSSSRPARPTLKLKVAARRSADAPSKAPVSQPTDKKSRLKPGADWSEEYKRRMQEDMDALLR